MFMMSETEVLTTEDLRNRMFEALKKRGLIDVLKVWRQINDYMKFSKFFYYYIIFSDYIHLLTKIFELVMLF